LHNETAIDVRGWLDTLASASGREYQYQGKHHHTHHPSVQGPWNSYVYTDPSVATTEKFPLEELSKKAHEPKSATERMLELYEEQKKAEKQQASNGRTAGEDVRLSAHTQGESQ